MIRFLVIAAIAGFLGLAGPTRSDAAGAPRVTVIGDSVQDSFEFAPAAIRRLGRGLDLRFDAKVCRRLVAPSCPYNGVTPLTALQVVRSSGRGLGRIVIINVGYNESASGYDVRAVLSALRNARVRTVIWVNLREQRSGYAAVNARIRAAARADRRVRIVDWNARSAGRPWFASDGLHLNKAGALALSGLLRERVLAAL